MSPSDSTLLNCTHLILDEIHERDTNTDLLLLAVKNLIKQRPMLRVVIMSATLDSAKFYHYFKNDGLQAGKPIVIESPTNFPIKSFHLEDIRLPKRGLDKDSSKYWTDENSKGCAEVSKVPHSLFSNIVAELHLNKPDGAILCFLPGWEDIVAVKGALETLLSRHDNFRIFCVHSSSSADETLAMFRPISGVRKIILATNIAESSITIPDASYIVDSGMQKIMSFKPNLRMNSLELTWISQSNSLQRKGRIGRTQPGEYYQLWSKYRSLAPCLSPEILRVGLEDVCLTIKGLGFDGKCVDITQKLIDRPDRALVREAVASLIEIGAFDEQSECITDLGKELASLPLGPSKNLK
jgi:HrpA-like RNA helicase